MEDNGSGLNWPTLDSVLENGRLVIDKAFWQLKMGSDITNLLLIHDHYMAEFDLMSMQLEEIELNRNKHQK